MKMKSTAEILAQLICKTTYYFTFHDEGQVKQIPADLVIMELQLKYYKSHPAKLKTNVLTSN